MSQENLPQLEPWVASFNALGENLGSGAEKLVSLEPEALLCAARGATGLDDFGDARFREPFEIFCRSLEEEADLTLLGRVLARAEIQRLLQSRLEMQEILRREPLILDQGIEKPLFITGLARSGTTFLHELLWQDPANRVPLLWEMMYPAPLVRNAGLAPDDPRVAASHREIKISDEILPEFSTMHESAGHLPNECIFIFAHEFHTEMWLGQYKVESYLRWISGADKKSLYEAHRNFLQFLQWRHEAEQWVLKSPSHLAMLSNLFEVYPDAHVVVTHRDPVRGLGSLGSIIAAMISMRSGAVDRNLCIRVQSAASPMMVGKYMAQRDRGDLPEERITDIRYPDLVSNPIRTVASLYERLGRDLSADARDRMKRWLDAKASEPSAPHQHRFEDTGLDLATERAKYREYIARFDLPEEI